jgi:hypothetical protein
MAERSFKPNPRFFRDFANGPELRGILRSVAEDAKVIAEHLSTGIRSDREDNEHYADSFEVSTDTIEFHGKYRGPRVVGKLTNTSGHAAAVEWGYRGSKDAPTETSAHRVLGRTLDVLAANPGFGAPE